MELEEDAELFGAVLEGATETTTEDAATGDEDGGGGAT
jgi:hypothetical protein